jgi:hypothetical protein
MKDSLNTLKELASSVRNATKEGENSAERIGRLFEGILEYIKTPESIENYFELKQDSNGLDYIYTKYNIASAGALSMYASDKINVPSIYDGLPIDNDTIYWHEVDGSKVLKAKGGGGEAGSVQWDNISGKPSWIEDTKPSYSWSDITGEKPFYTKEEIASKYVTIDTEQEITALKHFTAGLSVGESKKKIYEENGVVYIDADVAVTGAMTFYASAGRSVSTIMDGVTVDEETITKGSDNVLRIKNAGAGSSFDENAMWSALSGSSDNQINKSHLTTALEGYATRNWVIENYATKSELSAVSNKLSDFLEGSDTDNIINKWKELEAFLSGMAETDNLAEILKTKADRSYVDSTFVTLATKQTITGEKTFSSVLNTAAIKASGAITAPSLAVSDWVTIAGIKLRKLEDGALMLEGNLALTGALTMYASNGQSFDTIYDGLPIDNDTIYWQEVEGSKVLKAKEGSGSSFDKSAMWTALAGSTTEQINKSHLTTALTGYATESWVSGKNYAVKATTLAGYGITDGINAVSVTGTGNAVTAASISGHTLTLTKASTFSLSGHKHAWADITSGKPSTLSGYGITDAYTKTESDNKYPTKTGSGASGTWGINVTGNAGSATKLQTARTLWGRSFDGTRNVSGNLDSVGNITLNRNAIIKGSMGGSDVWKIYTKEIDTSKSDFIIEVGDDMDERILCRQTYWSEDRSPREITLMGYSGEQRFIDIYINGIRLHKTADGVITLEGNLAVTGGITTYAIDPVSASTIMDGVVVDGTTIKKENGKLVAVGGGEAGSVAWGNISGKPSVFATNIANITDLHANWDALLKAAPSAYVTRWPTISEVTGKQNLIVKLNGGTTEGTNQFTYNATGAKTINITPAGIGAAASSHNHSWSNITSGKPTTLAGYGITDAPTKTGSGASGTWGININGNASNADKIDNVHNGDLTAKYLNVTSSTSDLSSFKNNGLSAWSTNSANKPSEYGVLFQFSNANYPVPGTDSHWVNQIAYGTNARLYTRQRINTSGWTSWKTIAFLDDNVNSASKLQNARKLWGNNFDGTGDVTGQIVAYNGIYLPYGGKIANEYGNILRTNYDNASGYNDFFEITAIGSNKIGKSLTGGNSGLLTWGGNRFIFNSYGVGWYAEDGEWMRTYNSLYVPKNIQCKGNIDCNSNVNCQTLKAYALDIAYGTNFKFVRMSWNGTSGDVASFFVPGSTSQWFTMELRSNGVLYINGDFLSGGGSTFYGSDIRYKSIIQQVKLSLLEIANAPSFIYRWNKHGMNQNRLNLGGSAQYAQKILPWAVNDNDNFLSMDYATVAYTFAVHTARHLMNYETRTDKKIKKLENRVKYLEKQLKKLGYEEVRTLDDSGI